MPPISRLNPDDPVIVGIPYVIKHGKLFRSELLLT
jgi:hypothetical protein